MKMTAVRKTKETKPAMKGIRPTLVMNDTEVKKAFAADMQAAKQVKMAMEERLKFKADVEHMNHKFTVKCLEQRAEFMGWINSEFEKAHKQGRRLGDFFTSMRTKLMCADEMSDNMIAALRKCKERDVPKPVEAGSPEKVITMTLKIRKFLQGKMNLDSRVITGVVKAESANAYLMEGHADMLETMSWCMRCGKPLTQPASFTIGYGETCAGHMGLSYPGALNLMTGKELREYRKVILGVLHKQKFERWIPKSQVGEILERKEEKPAVKKETTASKSATPKKTAKTPKGASKK